MRGRRRTRHPLSKQVVLKNATVPAALVEDPPPGAGADGLVRADVFIVDGKFERVAKPGHTDHYSLWEMGGRMVLPCFVDCHTHIDKGHISPRMPNPDGCFMSALNVVAADREKRWSAEDVARRMDFSLRCAYAHGTVALRTHIDSIPPQEKISWPVFEEMRAEWEGRIALQGVCLVTIELVRERAWFASLADRVAAARGVMGAATFMLPDLDALLDDVVRAATERGLDLDFHADETDDPQACALDRIADAVMRNGFRGRVLVGHCCSLARQADDVARRTLDKVAKAGLSVVCMPMCNMYLQDRRIDGTTPRWRGVTLLHEMKARGIPVAVASDNTRDPFYAYGDLDMVEVLREATRILQLDHPFGDWVTAVAAAPAKIMGLSDYGRIAPGKPAECIIFEARNCSELLARPQSDRLIIRNGDELTAELPDYRELDDLMDVPLMADISRLKSRLGGLKVEDNPAIVKQKSRDFFWYSPVLKRQLDHVTADLVVSPKSEAEVIEVLKACFEEGVPVTPRGSGTGNYGQAMPLSGGVVLSLADMNAVKQVARGRVVVEPGAILAEIDRQARPGGQEIRMHPSTYNTASAAGFIAGGSGGVGSINWGGLRNIGNVLSLRVVTMEATPRVLELEGRDLMKVMHAYGTNGIITEVELPLDAAYDWVDVIAGFEDYMAAVRFANDVANEDGLLFKEIATVAAPVPHDYFLRHKKFLKREHSVALLMVAPHAMDPFLTVAKEGKAEILYRSDTATDAEKKGLPPVFELTWNHTTLRGLRVDPTITYLQVLYPFPTHVESVERMTKLFGDEVPGHLEFQRFDGNVCASGLPIVRFTSEERLDEIVKIHEDNGCPIFNPHRYTLEEGGMKRTDAVQLAFKREADPKGLLNPGKMIAWDNPDYDWKSDKVYLFPGMQAAAE